MTEPTDESAELYDVPQPTVPSEKRRRAKPDEVTPTAADEPSAALFEAPPTTPRCGKPRPGASGPEGRRPSPPPILGAILGFMPIMPPGERPEWTGVYRLYDKDEVLLYVGMTNASVDRYLEHRETKEWWPDVTDHSIEWYMTREEADEREVYTIKDEWPVYNIAHQPRASGPFQIPSYVGELIQAQIARSVREVLPEASEDDADEIAEKARMAFGAYASDDDDRRNHEIEFCTSEAPRPEALNLAAVLNALGPFRPPIRNSMRDPQPQFEPRRFCTASTDDGRCVEALSWDGACPGADQHAVPETPASETA